MSEDDDRRARTIEEVRRVRVWGEEARERERIKRERAEELEAAETRGVAKERARCLAIADRALASTEYHADAEAWLERVRSAIDAGTSPDDMATVPDP